jgi:hypothetical protein
MTYKIIIKESYKELAHTIKEHENKGWGISTNQPMCYGNNCYSKALVKKEIR